MTTISNEITFIGHITWIDALKEGVSQSSGKAWASREFVIEERETLYPQSIRLQAKGEQTLAVLEQLSHTDFPEEPIFKAHLSFYYRTIKKDDGTQFKVQDRICWKIENVEGGRR